MLPDPRILQYSIDNFEAAPIMVAYLKEKNLKDVVIVSPDHGEQPARKFALNFGAPIAIIDKRRPKPNVAEVMNIIGDVEGKTYLVDDIVDTAGTVTVASEAKKAGAKEVYLVATHPVLSGNAVEGFVLLRFLSL